MLSILGELLNNTLHAWLLYIHKYSVAMEKLPFVLLYINSMRMDGPFLWKSTKPQNILCILKRIPRPDWGCGSGIECLHGIQKASNSIHSTNKRTTVLCLETETREDAQEKPACLFFCYLFFFFDFCVSVISLQLQRSKPTLTDNAI